MGKLQTTPTYTCPLTPFRAKTGRFGAPRQPIKLTRPKCSLGAPAVRAPLWDSNGRYIQKNRPPHPQIAGKHSYRSKNGRNAPKRAPQESPRYDLHIENQNFPKGPTVLGPPHGTPRSLWANKIGVPTYRFRVWVDTPPIWPFWAYPWGA